MAKERGDILKGLGVQRRGSTTTSDEADEADAAETSSDAGASSSSSGRALGIKRRGKGGAAAEDGEDGEDGESESKSSSGPPLGIKRRGKGGAAATGRQGRKKGEEPEAKVDPLAPVRGKLGNDDTAVMLASSFKTRPELAAQLPQRLWELERTHGHYSGDGRAERTIQIGWEPAYVFFTLPAYPDGPPKFTKDWKMIEPGPNRQPRFVETGFVIDEPYNELGEWYCYVVFKSDGQPVVPEPPPEAEPEPKGKKKRKGRGNRKKHPTGPKLGIKRRK